MNQSSGAIRDVSDTAVWVAVFRARETERPGGIFRDPLARRLAGARGEEIARAMRKHNHQWAYAMRTWLFDSFVRERVAAGVDLVLNLASGLDARPYRMDLPPSLRWVEVDLPELLDYKESILSGEKPKCRLERVRMDLADVASRRALFARLASEAREVLVLSEGLLIYLGEAAARGLADDLASHRSFRWWAFDLASPALMKMMKREVGSGMDNAPLLFAPPEGPWIFEQNGWRVADVRGTLKWAKGRVPLPLMLRIMSMLPERLPARKGPWAGVCLLENAAAPDQ